MNALRVLDTGLRPACWNIALTAVLAELHAAGEISDTLRFQRFEPCVLLGRHQDIRHAVRLDLCRQKGIALARRLTGGGAVYMDAGVLSWQLVADRRRFGAIVVAAGEKIGTAIALALSRLGLPAKFSPPNAVEVGGRKISGAGGYFEGASLVYEGTVLVDCDLAVIAEIMRSAPAQLLTSFAAEGGVPPLPEIHRAITLSISDHCGFRPFADRLSDREGALATALSAAKLGHDVDEWEPA